TEPIVWKAVLCRDHAFRKDQLKDSDNLKETYKFNRILKTNLKESRYTSEKIPLAYTSAHLVKQDYAIQVYSIGFVSIIDLNTGKQIILKLDPSICKEAQVKPGISMLDKDILLCPGGSGFSIYKASTGELIKKFETSVMNDRINEDLAAYL